MRFRPNAVHKAALVFVMVFVNVPQSSDQGCFKFLGCIFRAQNIERLVEFGSFGATTQPQRVVVYG